MDDFEDTRSELGAPLLLTPKGGNHPAAGLSATVKKRRLMFDAIFGVVFAAFTLAIVVSDEGVMALHYNRQAILLMSWIESLIFFLLSCGFAINHFLE